MSLWIILIVFGLVALAVVQFAPLAGPLGRGVTVLGWVLLLVGVALLVLDLFGIHVARAEPLFTQVEPTPVPIPAPPNTPQAVPQLPGWAIVGAIVAGGALVAVAVAVDNYKVLYGIQTFLMFVQGAFAIIQTTAQVESVRISLGISGQMLAWIGIASAIIGLTSGILPRLTRTPAQREADYQAVAAKAVASQTIPRVQDGTPPS